MQLKMWAALVCLLSLWDQGTITVSAFFTPPSTTPSTPSTPSSTTPRPICQYVRTRTAMDMEAGEWDMPEGEDMMGIYSLDRMYQMYRSFLGPQRAALYVRRMEGGNDWYQGLFRYRMCVRDFNADPPPYRPFQNLPWYALGGGIGAALAGNAGGNAYGGWGPQNLAMFGMGMNK